MDRNLEDIDSLSVNYFAMGGPVGQMPAAQPIAFDGPLNMADGGLININSLSVAAFAEGGEAGEQYESLEDVLADVPLQDDEQREWEQEIPVRDLTRQLNETVDRYRAGKASEADLRQFFPNYSDYDIANAFGMTDAGQSAQRPESLVQPFLNSQSYNRAADRARMEDYQVERDIRQKSPNIYPNNRDAKLQLQELAEGGEVKEEAAYTEQEIDRMRAAMAQSQADKGSKSPTQQAVKRIIPKSTAQGPQQKSSLARQQLYALPPYPLDMTGKLGQAGPIRRQDGSPPEGEIAQQMTVGTAPGIMAQASEEPGIIRAKEINQPATRSEQAMRAYLQASIPDLKIVEDPYLAGTGTRGQVNTAVPNVIMIRPTEKNMGREAVLLHEAEHSRVGKAVQGMPPRERLDNDVRFDKLYGDKGSTRSRIVRNFVANKDKIEKFFGVNIPDVYFDQMMYKNQSRFGSADALFEEQIATLSALEQLTNKSITKGMPELFPDGKAAAIYDAITGLRQTRLDARDLPPFTPQYKSRIDWIKEKLRMRANGSPEYGEIAEQMTVGTLPTDQKAAGQVFRDIGRDVVRGAQYLPYDLVGAPVDIATMAMRPFGYNVEKPFMGSDYLIEKARQAGIAEKPSGSAAETATRIGMGFVNPAAVARQIPAGIAALEKGVEGMTLPAFRQITGNPKATKEDMIDFVLDQRSIASFGAPGVIKPKGGVFPKAGTGSGIDNYLERVQELLARNAEGDLTIGQIKSINKFIEDKGRKYLTTTYGTGDDVLKEALLEGRLPTFGRDKKNFREYMLREARSGNPEALQDFELSYDTRTGLGQFVVTPSEHQAAANIRETASRQMLEKIKKEGVQEELITDPYLRRVETEDMLKGFSPEYQKNLARNLMNRELGMNRPVDVTDETLIRAAQQGEVFYDIPASPSLDFLEPKNLANSLATLNPDKLNNMSFAEAVVQGTKNTKLQRDWDEVIKKVESNKSIPKELYDIGTERFRPMGEDRWVRLTTPQAVQLEGAAMHHSIGNYAKKGGYGVGGLDALLSGKAQLFSLRGKDGRPRITIEAQKNEDGTLLVRQIKGNFNGVPEPQDQEIVVEFLKGLPIDKIQPESYAKSATGEELAERVRIDWSDKAGFGARSIF